MNRAPHERGGGRACARGCVGARDGGGALCIWLSMPAAASSAAAWPASDMSPSEGPRGAQRGGSDCPEGAALAAGDALSWTSDGYDQGSVGDYDNGCAAEGTCGLPYSGWDGLGGGWQLCFA